MSDDGAVVVRDPRRGKAKVDFTRPRFDFGRLSFRDTVELSRLEAQLVRAQVLQERINRGTADDETLNEVLRLAESMDAVFAAYREMFAKTVIELPRDWFVEDAPPELDFGKPETYQWLRADRVQTLRQMMQEAQQKAANQGKA